VLSIFTAAVSRYNRDYIQKAVMSALRFVLVSVPSSSIELQKAVLTRLTEGCLLVEIFKAVFSWGG
jgi:hypothetical protein